MLTLTGGNPEQNLVHLGVPPAAEQMSKGGGKGGGGR